MLKILITVVLIYLVWNAFKYRRRIAEVHKDVMARKARDSAKAQAADVASQPPGTPLAQDLLPCLKCGAYIAQGAVCSCEKA
jgi:hypothetical protein